jgi:hypothetical protein
VRKNCFATEAQANILSVLLVALTSAQLDFRKYLHDHARAQPHGNVVDSDTSSNEKDNLNMELIEQSRV